MWYKYSCTDGETVLNALKKVFYDPPIEPCDCEPQTDLLELPFQNDSHPRRTSGASSVSGTVHVFYIFYIFCLNYYFCVTYCECIPFYLLSYHLHITPTC